MIYRRIHTACGSEILEPLSEIERAIYNGTSGIKSGKETEKKKSAHI